MLIYLVAAYLLAVNVIAFLLFVSDKRRARQGRWRIPERTLITAAVLGGSLGALCGMHIAHHKTRHWYFRYGIPLILAAQLAAAGFILRAVIMQ